MKRLSFFLITVIVATQLYCNGYARSGAQNDFGGRYEEADIPLVQEGYNYYIKPSTDNENPYIVMLPLSAVLYEYADISWDEGRGHVTVTCGTLEASMKIGEVSYVINGENAILDAAPEVIDGAVYVPSTFFEKTFGFWMTDSGDGVIDLFIPSFIIDNI